MLNKVMAALLAAAAMIPAAASAQDAGAARRELERGDGSGDEGGRAAVFERRAEAREARMEQRQAEPRPAFRPERPANPAPSFRPERAPDQPRPAAPEQARADRPDRGGWGRRGGDAAAPQPERQRDWARPDRGQPQADWRRPDTVPVPPAVDQRRADDARRAQADRRWDGRRDDGRQWNGARPDNGRRDDNRRWTDNRRDDTRWNDGRRNDGRWNDSGRQTWNWNDRNGRTDWSRRWRDNNRYDWGRYRQQNRNVFRLPRYYAPYNWNYGYRRFSIGVSLSSVLWGQDYWISDPWYYRLPEAYGPYRWVRYYNDALLVDLRSGEVVDAVYDIFW